MRKLIRYLLLASLLIAAAGLLGPYIENALYAMRLASMPAPTRLLVPVAGVRRQALADTWGAARSGKRRHEGIDIFSRRGTPVLSATEGIVMRVGTNRLGGQVVWVLGPAGQRHYYAHLDRFADVRPGMRVEAGRTLGYVGTTGNAKGTPPHLHYGIYGVGAPPIPIPSCAPLRNKRTAVRAEIGALVAIIPRSAAPRWRGDPPSFGRMKMKALYLLLLVSGSVMADDAAILKCRSMNDAAARLGCYDAIQVGARATAAAAAQGFEPEVKAPKEAFDPVESTIAGNFRGWGPGTQITLANGQVWRVVDRSEASLQAMKDRKAKVERNFFGTLLMTIEGADHAPKVRRIK